MNMKKKIDNKKKDRNNKGETQQMKKLDGSAKINNCTLNHHQHVQYKLINMKRRLEDHLNDVCNKQKTNNKP